MATSLKRQHRVKRHHKIRMRISGTSVHPRVSVFRSNQHLYVQVVDDVTHKTLVGLSDAKVKPGADTPKELGAKAQRAFALGKTIAEKMKEKHMASAVLDRGGFQYHGRVKAFTDGLRAGGITI